MKKYRDGGIYTADMGQPPQDIDGGSAPPKKPALKRLTPKQSEAARNGAKKELSEFKRRPTGKLTKDDLMLTGKDKSSYAKGGKIDGIAKRGRTKCKTV